MLRSDVQDGDLFLMCSDGLNDLVSDAQIAEVMSRHAYQLEQMTERLISLANEEGGTDNITVIALRAEEENTPSMFA